ncbi:MAG: hypothetical protein CMJ70_06185 [Planctomycetaceae bacterium]|nr:hypothetical protein [Planctomycetaceae bacterium]
MPHQIQTSLISTSTAGTSFEVSDGKIDTRDDGSRICGISSLTTNDCQNWRRHHLISLQIHLNIARQTSQNQLLRISSLGRKSTNATRSSNNDSQPGKKPAASES